MGMTQPADLSQTRVMEKGENELKRSENCFFLLWPGIGRTASDHLPGPHV